MSDVNWYRSCRGVESGAHSLWITEYRKGLLLRKRSRIVCQEKECDLDIRTVYPRFIWIKNRGESIWLYLVCSWPGRQVKKRRWVRVVLRLNLIAAGIGILCAAVMLLAAWTSGILK